MPKSLPDILSFRSRERFTDAGTDGPLEQAPQVVLHEPDATAETAARLTAPRYQSGSRACEMHRIPVQRNRRK
jgi:hypothetical protein